MNGLFDVAQLAAHYNARGVGIWALGMENNDAQMIAALDCINPGAPPGTGPQLTSSSPAPGAPPPAAPSNGPPPVATASGTGHGRAHRGAIRNREPAQPLRRPPRPPPPAPFINAQRTGKTIALTPVDASQVIRLTADGQVTDFETNEQAYSCLNGTTLNVFTNLKGQPVAVAATPTNCITQDFLLP